MGVTMVAMVTWSVTLPRVVKCSVVVVLRVVVVVGVSVVVNVM